MLFVTFSEESHVQRLFSQKRVIWIQSLTMFPRQREIENVLDWFYSVISLNLQQHYLRMVPTFVNAHTFCASRKH